jgi:hypothetical protein
MLNTKTAILTTNEASLQGLNNKPVPIRVNLLWWQEKGLSYTASGYSSKMPTQNEIFIGKYWYRVYCSVFSNVGVLSIYPKGVRTIIDLTLQ